MTRHAFVFPGQGSQFIGMGLELAKAFPVSKSVFDEIDDALNQHLSRLMFEGDASELTATENAQPALFAVSLATVRALEEQGGFQLSEKADYVAGHSLGEYSALAASGVLTIAEGARLLRLRGQAMQRAVPAGKGGMAALLGVETEQAKELCLEAAQNSILEIANDNGGGQIVVSGSIEAIDRVIELAKAKGIRRAVKLPVSAPFHSSLMQPAAKEMAEALEGADLKDAKIDVVPNVSVEFTREAKIFRTRLVEQVTGQVRWRETVSLFAQSGITHHHELGAGKVLTGLARRIAPDLTTDFAGTPAEIETMLKTL
ncbi:ACP S-malonyltransferase [Aristophania vespae]|uniref:Malonyl CoA-acyl carrier protein transacylase n=1 Tax=Aristophania vespae TaxID=2697033 RepID=A0A6P1NDS1_9PROT|nr:ACP S-malonyltransferase [Aristophania vespae]QHI95603.1 ACP S-malonyltransferase [Aristophania vespae]UMM63270.1 Malonyl CoA-acyl carrier protein transacylase [Aristophania vespae]